MGHGYINGSAIVLVLFIILEKEESIMGHACNGSAIVLVLFIILVIVIGAYI